MGVLSTWSLWRLSAACALFPYHTLGGMFEQQQAVMSESHIAKNPVRCLESSPAREIAFNLGIPVLGVEKRGVRYMFDN